MGSEMSGSRGRIIVTGGSGFIGGELVPKLAESGYEVYILERYVTGRYVLGGQRNVYTVFADMRDAQALRQVIREVQPDKVVHLAALSAVSYSYDHPQEVIETNFLGTVNLAEACMKEVAHFSHFLFAGTSEEYGNNGVSPKTEESELRPNSPYSVSKVAADKYLRYLWEANRFPVTIMRPFNSYGRTDNSHFIVERTIKQALAGKDIRLGDPKPVRDFLYVDDHVNAYLTCIEKPKKSVGEVFNFCTGHGVTIKQLVDKVTDLVGLKGRVRWDTIPKRPLDISELIGDSSRAQRVLGWRPKVTLEEGLRRTISHWKSKP